MTVIRPNSISGITSITAQANEINVFRSNGLIAGLNLNGVNFNTTSGISTLAALKVTGNVDVAGVLTYQDVTNVDSLGIGTFRVGVNVPAGQLDVGSNIKLGNAGVITATSFSGSGANLTGIPAQATIANNGNDRIITGGSGVNLNGEANLQFDGTDLYVSDKIKHLGDPDTLIEFATDTITFDTAGAEALRITSGGDISIGGRDEALNNYAAGSTTTKLAVVKNGAGSGYHEIAHFTGGTDSNDTGAIVRITQFNNDRGLYIKGGRGTGDVAKAIFGLRNSGAADNDVMTFIQGGKIGINETSPDYMLHISGSVPAVCFEDTDGTHGQSIIEQNNDNLKIRCDAGNASSGTGSNISLQVDAFERLKIASSGALTNTTNSSHPQGAGTFNVQGVINQYSQGSGSGLIFDCDFGRLTGYSDDSSVNNGTNLSACLAHSTTDWTSSSSNTPMTVNGGTFQYRVGFGGYMEGISNGGRVLVTAGSGNPAMSDKLNTASMTIEVWCWYDGTGREVLVSRYGSGYPNQFNMLTDPDGQFHYNNDGVGGGSGNVSGEHFPDKTWHHHLWQYESGVNRWYINGAFANSRSAGSSLAVGSNTGFGIFSRADDYERFRGKIAVVRIYNRALSATEIKNHFELERGRFGV